jgi:hypothetical protein
MISKFPTSPIEAADRFRRRRRELYRPDCRSTGGQTWAPIDTHVPDCLHWRWPHEVRRYSARLDRLIRARERRGPNATRLSAINCTAKFRIEVGRARLRPAACAAPRFDQWKLSRPLRSQPCSIPLAQHFIPLIVERCNNITVHRSGNLAFSFLSLFHRPQ